MYQEKEDYQSWICDKCQKELELTKVKVHYLEGEFEVELLNCPTCHQVFINESLALGKMAEVEQGLEDK
ncbi:DNA-binding protein [Acetobacterium paludosum]|uniref:DNA-binding protein n=1 Tax=Acetobacterium paludosum TaxID=52693 RepID=A0A923HZ27_9FIRM|nr:CLJU_RS11820 family redox protein [Acetobacterium paludosum]MBC3887188.1 DNA-binding protein [Acetobacterium paludosum]